MWLDFISDTGGLKPQRGVMPVGTVPAFNCRQWTRWQWMQVTSITCQQLPTAASNYRPLPATTHRLMRNTDRSCRLEFLGRIHRPKEALDDVPFAVERGVTPARWCCDELLIWHIRATRAPQPAHVRAHNDCRT